MQCFVTYLYFIHFYDIYEYTKIQNNTITIWILLTHIYATIHLHLSMPPLQFQRVSIVRFEVCNK